LQQVGAKGFADAQLVDPRHLPVPLNDLSRRARINLGHAWVLHRKLFVRAIAAGIALVGIVGAYEARDAITASALGLVEMAESGFARAGFGISKINFTGQVLTSEATLLTALGLDSSVSTLNFDADAALSRIQGIASVKSASIRKVYPGELIVTIEEKLPMARWRIGEATYLVDENGSPVARDDGSFRDLPLVVGQGAADDAIVMIRALERYPAITADLAALSRIGDRRWDLIFYSGLRVQLPESGVAQALQQLDNLQAQQQILDRDILVIDMRVAGMMSLKLGELSIAARADAAKAAKKKPVKAVAVDPDYASPGTAQ
jgi:cell division protein FtsQ